MRLPRFIVSGFYGTMNTEICRNPAVLSDSIKSQVLFTLILLTGALNAPFAQAQGERIVPPDQILDNSGRGSLPTPNVLRSPLPPNTQGMPTPPPIDSKESPAARAASEKLDTIVEDSIKSMGSMFVDPEQVIVKPPMLTALITLNEKLNPYSIESSGSRAISLSDVLNAAYGQNLNIKIASTTAEQKRWLMFSSVGGFLPTLSNEVTYQGITGNYISPAGANIPIQNYYLNTNSGFSQNLYRGGSVIHTYLQNKHNYKAAQHAIKLATNDELYETAKQYYDLALNEVKLQIKIKTVETSEALLLINKDLYANGVNTMLEVLQAKTQLSRDRQALIKQQVARRESAVKLAETINENGMTDYTLGSPQIRKIRLVDTNLGIKELMQMAVDNRPELKRYEELRLAALESIKVAKAPLLPQIQAIGSIVGTSARIASSNNSSQQTPFATSGGASVGGVSGASGLPAGGSSNTGERHKSGRALYVIGVDMQWQFGGLGVTTIGQINAARAEARNRQLEFLRELNRVYKQVHDAYLNIITAENLIIETTSTVESSKEQLRVAKDRLENGVGTNLDVVNAQRDYTSALVDKADAIIQFNTAEAELLRAVGKISIPTLVATSPLRQ